MITHHQALAGAVVLCIATAAQAQTITGRASVVDSDTIEIAGERIRLHGIDAPESDQRCQDKGGRAYQCGQVAADALDAFLAQSRPTSCRFMERDRYRRFVGDCYRADGNSVAAWMVRKGHALDWPRYSRGTYAADQAEARRSGAGMWWGRFVEPWEWRRGER